MSSEKTVRARTAGILHAETTTVAGDARHNLVRWHPSLCDHSQCVLGFRQVDVGAKAIAILTPRADKAVVPIPLAVKIIGHEHDIIQDIGHFRNGEALQIPV